MWGGGYVCVYKHTFTFYFSILIFSSVSTKGVEEEQEEKYPFLSNCN